MVTVLPPVLSDHPPDLAQRAGLGDRFHYFRGQSGRRYLFSRIAPDELADFRSVVVALAKQAPGGRVAICAMTRIDACGRQPDTRHPWPTSLPAGAMILVHLLAVTDTDRHNLIDDLTAMPLPLAA